MTTEVAIIESSDTPVPAAPTVHLTTCAPIPIVDLKRKFTEDIEFIIDYKNSKFKNKVLITYLSNLDLKCRLMLENQDESLELVVAYMHHPALAKIDDLLDVVINILLYHTNHPCLLSFDPSDFIEANIDIINVWLRRIAALRLYAFFTDSSVDREFFNKWPVTPDDENMAGINYVHLIAHPLFHLLIDDIPLEAMTYSPFHFNEYVFSGKNLYTYFAVPQNPLYMATVARYGLDQEQLDRMITAAHEED